MGRHVSVALEMLLKLVAVFGPVIHSTISAPPGVGVNIQAERRYCLSIRLLLVYCFLLVFNGFAQRSLVSPCLVITDLNAAVSALSSSNEYRKPFLQL